MTDDSSASRVLHERMASGVDRIFTDLTLFARFPILPYLPPLQATFALRVIVTCAQDANANLPKCIEVNLSSERRHRLLSGFVLSEEHRHSRLTPYLKTKNPNDEDSLVTL